MGTVKAISARERLHHIVDIIDDNKVEAMLTLLHDVEEEEFELTDELKAELDEIDNKINKGEMETQDWNLVREEMKAYIKSKK